MAGVQARQCAEHRLTARCRPGLTPRAQVIQLTRDLLADAGTAEQPSTSGAPAAEQQAAAGDAGPSAAGHPVAAITTAPDLRLPSVLPPQVAQQIREAQQRAAMAGQAPPSWAIGAKCQAIYSGDGQWCVLGAGGGAAATRWAPGHIAGSAGARAGGHGGAGLGS